MHAFFLNVTNKFFKEFYNCYVQHQFRLIPSEDNKSKILSDGSFKLIPTKIYISSDNKIYCGNYIPIGAKDIINSFKVEIGKEYKIIRNNKEYNISSILNILRNTCMALHKILKILSFLIILNIKIIVTKTIQ